MPVDVHRIHMDRAEQGFRLRGRKAMIGELAPAQRQAQGAAHQRSFDKIAGVARIVHAFAGGYRIGLNPGKAVEVALADFSGELLAQSFARRSFHR